jgi:hypothetical protein
VTRALKPLAVALALTLGGPAAAAQAAYFSGQTVDGPSADVESLGGVALSRDGGGQVVYLKREGGVSHVFVSLLAEGAPRQPRRLDSGQLTPSSEPRVAAGDNGRAVAVWVNAGSLWAALRPNGSADWQPPEAVYSAPLASGAASDPHLSMGPSGAAYVTFQVGGDVRVARLGGSTWTLIGEGLDIDPGRTASQGSIATSADGTAIAAWSEGGQVWVRRIVRTRLSASPRQASADSLDGGAGGPADSPSIDIEDDSSYAWVVLRQDFGGVSRVIARRLIGSEFEPAVAIDAGSGGSEAPRFDMTGRGRGLAAVGVRGSQLAMGTTLGSDNAWGGALGIGNGSPFDPRPVAALSENGRGTIAWQSGGGAGAQVLARFWNARRFEDLSTLSDPALGPVDTGAGLDAAADTGGNQAVAYVQGQGADRRVLVAVYDKEPRTTGGGNHDDWNRTRNFQLKWSKVEDSWGQVQYRVDLDGVPVTTTPRTAVNVRDLPDGRHVYSVTAVDSRGQATEGPNRLLYVDLTAPTATLTARRAKVGKPAPIYLTAADGEAIAGSGVKTVTVRYGDGRTGLLSVPRIGFVDGAKLGYRYRKPGRYTVRVEVVDNAGNRRVVKTRVVVRK